MIAIRLKARKAAMKNAAFRDVPVYGTKLYVITPDTFTGWPESWVGLKRALRAAWTAAARSNG